MNSLNSTLIVRVKQASISLRAPREMKLLTSKVSFVVILWAERGSSSASSGLAMVPIAGIFNSLNFDRGGNFMDF